MNEKSYKRKKKLCYINTLRIYVWKTFHRHIYQGLTEHAYLKIALIQQTYEGQQVYWQKSQYHKQKYEN